MAAKEKTEGVVAVADDLAQPVAEYIPGTEQWAAEGTDTIVGHDLAKGELLDTLVGVPFAITRLTFRRGIPKRDGTDSAVCAVEGVIAPEDVLKRRRVNMAELPWEPGAQIVFNDGSTGIYRQLVQYISEVKGYVTLPEGLPEGGGYGESRYDLAHWEWSRINAGEVTTDRDGNPVYTINIRLTCPRGIRVSEYESDYNPAGGRTRYLG